MENGNSGVTLENVVKVYDGGVQVIHGVNLEIGRGEFVVFVGPSGCGKSTLMRMVAGLESVSGGTISIEGRVVNDLPPRERDIGMVFQDYALYPHKSVFDNLAFGLKLRKTPAAEIDQRVRATAAILKIDHLLERKPRALSGGQRQRVAMGRAIVRNAKLFLFDEPLSNLDALLRAEMRTEIKKLHQRVKATTIYVTHDQVEAMTLAERIVVLSAGRIMQVGTPEQIYHHPVSKFVAGFTGSPPMNFLPVVPEGAGASACVRLGEASLPLPAALAGKLSQSPAKALELGIRPEDIWLENAAHTNRAALKVAVVVVEPLGAETLVTLQCATGEMVARMPPNVRFAPGTEITVYFDLDKLHLFDPASGMALNSTLNSTLNGTLKATPGV
jgi:multiple sugar transport system ATP-binding protein